VNDVAGGQTVVERRSAVRATGRARTFGLGKYGFVAPAVLFIVLLMIYPIFYNLYTSVYDVTVANFMSGAAPFIGLGNYSAVVRDPDFGNALVISILFTAGSLVFQFVIGFALALYFNRRFPANGVLRAFLLLAWILPAVVSGNIFRWMLDGDFGIANFFLEGVGIVGDGRFWLSGPGTALASTIVANIWVGVPFNMVLLLAGLQGIPPDLHEAASVDGAGAWSRFKYITLPLMRPVALSVLMLGVIYTFKVFDLIFVMTKGGPVNATTVLPIYVYKQTFEFFRFGEGAAGAVLLLIAPLVLAVLYSMTARREEVL
jgi:multiple sugar transport system permease protein